MAIGEVASKISVPRAAPQLGAPAAQCVFTIETMLGSLPAVGNFVKPHKGFRSIDTLRAEPAQLLRARVEPSSGVHACAGARVVRDCNHE